MSPLLVDARNGNDPRDQALNGFGPEAGAWRKRDLASCPIKSGAGPRPRRGRSSRDEGGAGSAGTLAKIVEAIAELAILRVLRILPGALTEPD